MSGGSVGDQYPVIPRERLTAFSGYPRRTQRVAMWRASANRDARIRDTYRDYEGMDRTRSGPIDSVNGIYENGIAQPTMYKSCQNMITCSDGLHAELLYGKSSYTSDVRAHAHLGRGAQVLICQSAC